MALVPRSPFLLLALAPLFWSGNFVIGKLLGEALPPFTLSALRWTIGALVLLPLVVRRGEALRAALRWWRSLSVLGATGVAGYTPLVYLALADTTTVNAALIQAAIPAVTAVLTVLVLRAPVGPRQWVGIAVAFVGVTWIVARGEPASLAALQLNRGDLLMVANVLLWAVYTVVAQRVLRHVDGLIGTFLSVLVGLALLLPVATWEMAGRQWPSSTPELAAALLYLGVFPSILAYLCWNRGVAAVGAALSASFVNLLPVYTAVLASLFLGEWIAWHHLAGGMLVAGGVYVGTRAR